MNEQKSVGTKPWIEAFVRSQLEEAAFDHWVERIFGRVVAGVPQVHDDPVLHETVRRASIAHWRSFLSYLGEPERDFRMVPDAVDVAMVVAQRGYPLHTILRIYAEAQREVWQYIIAALDQLPPGEFDEKEVLVHFWTRASIWIERATEESLEIYRVETDRIRQGESARWLDSVRAILDEQVTDPKRAASSLGGHPVSGFNTALVLHTSDDSSIADLRAVAVRITELLRLRHPLVVHPGGRDLWCWVSSRSAPDLTRLHSIEDWLAERQVTVAVGAPAEGLSGFRRTHGDALAAQRVGIASQATPSLTLFTDVELLTLISDVDRMKHFVERTLGPLADLGEGPARLRETVHTLLITGNVESAASALLVHKNTVRYRLDRAEEMLGRPVLEAHTDIELALRWHARFIAPPPSGSRSTDE